MVLLVLCFIIALLSVWSWNKLCIWRVYRRDYLFVEFDCSQASYQETVSILCLCAMCKNETKCDAQMVTKHFYRLGFKVNYYVLLSHECAKRVEIRNLHLKMGETTKVKLCMHEFFYILDWFHEWLAFLLERKQTKYESLETTSKKPIPKPIENYLFSISEIAPNTWIHVKENFSTWLWVFANN